MPTIINVRRSEAPRKVVAWSKRPEHATEEWPDYIDRLILAGWGSVPQPRIPADWQNHQAPRPGPKPRLEAL